MNYPILDRATTITSPIIAQAAWNCYEQGTLLLAAKHYCEAVACFERAIAILPVQAEFWTAQGNALANLGDYSIALERLNRAIALKLNCADSWLWRGVVLLHLGRNSEALASCNTALELEPQNQEAWLFRAAALQRLGRYKAAYASYDQAFGAQRISIKQRFTAIWHWFRSRFSLFPSAQSVALCKSNLCKSNLCDPR
jgi:tetratricopeptide (TPR) repeat protein